MILSLIRLLIFGLSVYGYMAFCKEKIKVEDDCLPVIVFSGIGSVVFLSGILNVMTIVFGAVYLLGLVLAVYYIIKEREYLPRSRGLCVFAVFVILLLVFLTDEKYYHYDNFSHWGVVIKNIYKDSEFPNFQDGLIAYQAYPLGSASFIWYVCKAIGYSEGLTLFAQSMFILSCSLPLFMFTRQMKSKVKWLAEIVVGLVCIIGVCYGANIANGPFNLLVDKLLAFIAVAAFVIVYRYRFELNKGIISVIPLLTFVIVVKNSGIMWVVAILLEVICFWIKRSNRDWKQIRLVSILLALPMVFRYFWDRHVDLVFATGNVSNHAMSAENYSSTLAEKTSEDIAQIRFLFLEKVFSVENKIWVLLGILIVLLVVSCLFERKILKKINGLFIPIFTVLMYIIYQVGNYVMYMVSMPLGEAKNLAGYSRYVATVELFVWGIIIMTLFVIVVQIEQAINHKLCALIVVVFGIGALYTMTDDISMIYKHAVPAPGRQEARERMDEIIEKYQLEPNKKSLVYIGNPQDRDVGYRGYMSKYTLYSNDVTIVYSDGVGILRELADYDYLIVLQRDENIDNCLKEQSLPITEDCIVVDNYQYIKAADYIKSLDNDNYVVFISVFDEASSSFTNEIRDAMFGLGLTKDLTGQYRKSYAAIIDSNHVVYEQLSDEKVEYAGKGEGLEYSVVSAGWSAGNQSQIILNGIDYSLNSRGINIVVYDKTVQTVVDQIVFDTWLQDGKWILK